MSAVVFKVSRLFPDYLKSNSNCISKNVALQNQTSFRYELPLGVSYNNYNWHLKSMEYLQRMEQFVFTFLNFTKQRYGNKDK